HLCSTSLCHLFVGFKLCRLSLGSCAAGGGPQSTCAALGSPQGSCCKDVSLEGSCYKDTGLQGSCCRNTSLQGSCCRDADLPEVLLRRRPQAFLLGSLFATGILAVLHGSFFAADLQRLSSSAGLQSLFFSTALHQLSFAASLPAGLHRFCLTVCRPLL
uniref:Uncharacterized protein n=1 Tax=Cyprinodon variegatus TaxID=28743 RepID=A0A3Q2FW87_CYPVA